MTASKRVKVINEVGFHARPAMAFVDLANSHTSSIKVFKHGDDPAEADGKSILQMLTLAAVPGTEMTIEADGPDAQQAVEKLAKLFEEKFGEK